MQENERIEFLLKTIRKELFLLSALNLYALLILYYISVSDGLDNLKSHREQMSKMQKQIKDYKREVDYLSSKIKESIFYCKEKENESIITIKPVNPRN